MRHHSIVLFLLLLMRSGSGLMDALMSRRDILTTSAMSALVFFSEKENAKRNLLSLLPPNRALALPNTALTAQIEAKALVLEQQLFEEQPTPSTWQLLYSSSPDFLHLQKLPLNFRLDSVYQTLDTTTTESRAFFSNKYAHASLRVSIDDTTTHLSFDFQSPPLHSVLQETIISTPSPPFISYSDQDLRLSRGIDNSLSIFRRCPLDSMPASLDPIEIDRIKIPLSLEQPQFYHTSCSGSLQLYANWTQTTLLQIVSPSSLYSPSLRESTLYSYVTGRDAFYSAILSM